MQSYDSTAHMYDMRYAEEQNTKIRVFLKSIDINNKDLVLDVGCGTGLLFNHIADKADTIIGLDISEKTLLIAKERIKNFSHVHLIHADADAIPSRDKVFNHVLAITLLQNTPKPNDTLNEIKRVAKDDATIVVTGLKKAISKESFTQMLRDVGFKILAFKDEITLKCYITICSKIHR